MKLQWNLLLGFLFALLVAIVAVANIAPVSINYLFGRMDVPLILVILGSSLAGALIVGLFGIVRQYRLQRKIKRLETENEQLKTTQDAAETDEEAALKDPEDDVQAASTDFVGSTTDSRDPVKVDSDEDSPVKQQDQLSADEKKE